MKNFLFGILLFSSATSFAGSTDPVRGLLARSNVEIGVAALLGAGQCSLLGDVQHGFNIAIRMHQVSFENFATPTDSANALRGLIDSGACDTQYGPRESIKRYAGTSNYNIGMVGLAGLTGNCFINRSRAGYYFISINGRQVTFAAYPTAETTANSLRGLLETGACDNSLQLSGTTQMGNENLAAVALVRMTGVCWIDLVNYGPGNSAYEVFVSGRAVTAEHYPSADIAAILLRGLISNETCGKVL